MYSPLFTRLGRDYQLELEREAERRASSMVFISLEADSAERMRKLVETAEAIFAVRVDKGSGCDLCCEGGD